MSYSFFPSLCFTGTLDAIKKAVNAGANVNSAEYDGYTGLIYAAFGNKNPDVISFLLDAGADLNAVTTEGKSALILALDGNENPEVIFRLIKAGADVNIVDSNGWSALMYALERRNEEIILALINAGADITIKDYMNKTVLDIAKRKISNEKILRMLEVPATPTAISNTAISSSPSASDIDANVDSQANEEHIKTMKTLVTKFGPDIYIDSKRFSGLISDYFASDKRMKKILLIAVQDGVAAEIHAIRGSEPENFQFEISRIAKKFIDENALVESTGREVINCLIGGLLDIKLRS